LGVSVELTPNGTHGAFFPRLAMRLVNGTVFRLFRNRRFAGAHLLMLNTVGARTGQQRKATLGYFADGDNAWLIVGSVGGAARHPTWVYNLAKHPDQVSIELGNRALKVKPRTLKGDERARAWQRIIAEAANYAEYPARTDREIPIIRLTPA
jgi:deazaflavin-dependent oxidoreductase (nitroreductase family)